MDSRIMQWMSVARVAVEFSTRLQPGEKALIRRPLTSEEPVILHIENGYVVKVEGGPAATEWKRMGDELHDPRAFAVAEYGFGCHPRARAPVGWPVEDERIYGGFHYGIGSNTAFGGTNQSKWHIDASCLQATAWLTKS